MATEKKMLVFIPANVVQPQSGFKFSTHKLAKCDLNLKNASRKIKHSNLLASPIFWQFFVGQSESRRREVSRYCLCAVMIFFYNINLLSLYILFFLFIYHCFISMKFYVHILTFHLLYKANIYLYINVLSPYNGVVHPYLIFYICIMKLYVYT